MLAALAMVLQFACDTPADSGEAAAQRGDHAEAIRIWRGQAQAGDPQAMNNLGVMYYMGLGVPRDPAHSAGLFLKAARKRDHKAQFNLGIMYYNGYGVPADLFQAYMWLYAADYAGHARARAYIIVMGSLITTNMMKKAQNMAVPYLAEAPGP